MDYCDVIIHYMTSYIINFVLYTLQLPYNEDLLWLICENSSSSMGKIKPFFRVHKGAPGKSTDISKIRDRKIFWHVPRVN